MQTLSQHRQGACCDSNQAPPEYKSETIIIIIIWPPLWSSSKSSWLQIEVPGSIPGATGFSESSGSGTVSTQPREDNWGVASRK
jgi:hypothetical protein